MRLALGARPLDVVGLVLRRGLWLGLVGTALGLVLALLVGRSLRGILYGVAPFEPGPLLLLALVLLAVVVVASVLPARRAAAVDPLVSLRVE